MPGFIPGSRGSLMLDLVVLAMIAVLPALGYAILLVKRKQYLLHKRAMLSISIALLIAVIAFEIEMRLVGWQQLAEPSPYFNSLVPVSLGIHLVFSITAAMGIATTVFLALRRFTQPPRPNQHSDLHMRLGKISALSLFLTSITGWIFYWLAFVAV